MDLFEYFASRSFQHVIPYEFSGDARLFTTGDYTHNMFFGAGGSTIKRGSFICLFMALLCLVLY